MFPGLTTKISETEGMAISSGVLSPKTDLAVITDTTSTTVLTTITPPFGGFSGVTILVNQSGNNITTLTTGNIMTAVTIGQNVAVLAVYSKLNDKYFIGALA